MALRETTLLVAPTCINERKTITRAHVGYVLLFYCNRVYELVST